jgi:transposase-like protein
VAGMTPTAKSPYAGYRFPAEVISHAVWLSFRFRFCQGSRQQV